MVNMSHFEISGGIRMGNYRKIVYRTTLRTGIISVVNVRSCGHYVVGNEWEDPRFVKPFLQFFWGVKGRGNFRCGDRSWQLPPEHVCCYFPGDYHEITPLGSEWEYYWFTCDGPYLDILRAGFSLQREACYAGKCPVELFHQLEQELRDIGRGGCFRAGATAYRILALAAAADNLSLNDPVNAFRELVAEHYGDGSLSVNEICEILGIHRATLARQVEKHLGMSAREYIIAYRIQKALKLLCESSRPIKEIAEACGFNDYNYFGKVIRKHLGRSPAELRRNSAGELLPAPMVHPSSGGRSNSSLKTGTVS